MSNYPKDALAAAKRRLLGDDEVISTKRHKDHNKEKDSHKKKKKEKKAKKKKSHKKHKSRSSSESSSSSDEESWVEKETFKAPEKKVISESSGSASQRDDWMNMTGMFATFTRDDIRPDRDKKKKGHIDSYNPSTSTRELNPFWKDGGTGLPSEEKNSELQKRSQGNKESEFRRKEDYFRDDRDRYSSSASSSRGSHFKKPSYDDDSQKYSNSSRRDYRSERNDYNRDSYSSKKSWQKQPERDDSSRHERKELHEYERSPSPPDYDESAQLKSKSTEKNEDSVSEDKKDYLTDQQMNALGAKIVKAEILGNTKLVTELSAKLEAARKYKKLHPEASKKDEAVMLTVTDERGNTRPLTKAQNAGDPRSKGGKKRAVTHSVAGQRTKFFEDDEKYSLSEMFEKEKFGNAKESEEEFAKIVSKHTNPNDDLEDIFAESITKVKSDARREKDNMNKAISQHKSVQRSLENCEYCIDSDKMIKHMIVSLGNKAYVALPTRSSLTEGHCLISTVGHVTCSTIADEDVWSEIMSYRKALVNLFNSRDEDVIFFEVATHFHKYPHILIQCIPLPRNVGDTAPIYFKKAIMECEAEWSNNKKVVDLRDKDIRRGVPKGLPYFWVDFGMDPGFAHVIEDQQLFPQNFAQEIIGGMLDLDHILWRKPQRESFEKQSRKVLEFTAMWKPFDPTSSF